MKKAVFFDRDGTLIEEKNYISNPNNVIIINGVEEVFSYYNKFGYLIFIVSNQSGIARGKITTEQFLSVNNRTIELIKNGNLIKDSFFCPHHPTITGNCNCRKPEPGMLLEAKKKYNIDLSKSIIIGDKFSDIMLVKTANLNRGYLVKTGHGKEELISKTERLPNNVKVVESIKDVLKLELKINESE